jgi:hypothetical protein
MSETLGARIVEIGLGGKRDRLREIGGIALRKGHEPASRLGERGGVGRLSLARGFRRLGDARRQAPPFAGRRIEDRHDALMSGDRRGRAFREGDAGAVKGHAQGRRLSVSAIEHGAIAEAERPGRARVEKIMAAQQVLDCSRDELGLRRLVGRDVGHDPLSHRAARAHGGRADEARGRLHDSTRRAIVARQPQSRR